MPCKTRKARKCGYADLGYIVLKNGGKESMKKLRKLQKGRIILKEKKLKRIARWITAFAAALMLAAAFTFPSGTEIMGISFGNAIVASAAESSGPCGPNLTWTFDGTDTLTISGTGEMDNWDGVYGIPWLDYSGSIKSVVIENGVTSIGKCAFMNCSSLTSITIPDSVTSIGQDAFYDCYNLESIFLPNTLDVSVANITGYATQIKYTVTDNKVTITGVTLGSGQKSVTIPDTIDGKPVTVVYIPYEADGDVPASATQIRYTVDNENVIATVAALGEGQTSVTIPETIDGKAVTVVFTKDGTNISAPSSATQINYTVTDNKVTIKKGTLGSGQTSVTIPDTIDGKTVTSIGDSAFRSCTNLTSRTIPSGVTSIGDYAFSRCYDLTSITIPDSVTSIGERAFECCYDLTSITIPDGVTSIGENVFYSCEKLATVSFGNNSQLSSIGFAAFGRCKELTSITIPGSVNSIGNYAFDDCRSLTSIFLPERLTSIGTGAIPASASQIRYTVDNENVTITEVTLGSGQTSVTIPDTIGGKPVVEVDQSYQSNIGEHKHYFENSSGPCKICGKITCINSVSISIIEPKAAESLAAKASVSTTGIEAAPTITWQPNATSADYNTVYTATVTLAASTNYMFADSVSVSVNGTAVDSSNISYNENGTITVTYAFPATAKDELISFIITGRILTDTGASIEGNMTGPANYKLGQDVTLTVPVIAGYNFVGWYVYSADSPHYTGENLCTSRTYKFTAEEDRDLVAVYKPIGSANLTIDGGKDFTINGDNRTEEVTDPYPLGSQIEVVCNDSDFEYWKNSAGMVVSRDKSYTFTVTGRETISAVFNKKAENKATVVFESYYGQVIARDQYAAGATLAETPGLPFRYGYTALGWDYNGDGTYNAETDTFAKALERGFASDDKLVKILPVYQLKEVTYQITVVNGTGAGTYKQNEVVTVVANAASAGNKFSHWADGAGNILSYNEKYQFYAAKNITVTAVYVKDTVKVVAKGTTEIVDKYADKANGKLTFVSMSTVPEGCTIDKAGIIATNDQTVAESGDGFNAGTAAYVRGNSWTGNAYRYTWTKSKVGSGETWYVRAYLVYTDAEGNVNTVYGDMVSLTMPK